MKRKGVIAGIAAIVLLVVVTMGGWFLDVGNGFLAERGNGEADIRHIDSGYIVLEKGQSESFYVSGRVRIRNYQDYCVNVSPDEVFNITWTSDARMIFIEPKSGGREFVTVTIKPVAECNPAA